jgi:GT2 family glycosyltransferase
MIHTYTPYAPSEKNKNLGWAYNNFMEMVHDDDWVCFLDHDAMFTIPNWYNCLENAISAIEKDFSDIGLLTACTNRIGNVEQLIFKKDSEEAKNHDIYFHRKVGHDLYKEHNLAVSVAKNLISGVMILTSKKVWNATSKFKDGFLGVDNDYDRKVRNAGYKTVIMKGIYLYHWYRAAPSSGELSGWQYPESSKLPPIK